MPSSFRLRALVPALLLSTCLASSAWAAETTPAVEADDSQATGGTVILTLSGGLQLRPHAELFGNHELSLHEATIDLRKALRGPAKRIVLDLSEGYGGSLASAEELASIIRAEPRGGRTVACLLDGVQDNALVLAAACDETVLAGAGLLDIDGIAAESYYFKDALAKVGVSFHAVASGEHKTAHEPFTANAPSAAGAEELSELIHGLDRVLLDLSQRTDGPRALTREMIVAARAKAPQTPDLARELKLVDATADPGAWLAKQPGPITHAGEDPKTPGAGGMAGFMQLWTKLLQGDQGTKYAKAVAVVELAGEISGGGDSQPGQTIAPGDTSEMLDELADNERIKAVVLRIDSPGGDAGGSDRIHHAVRRLAAKKPVVALFDSVAASGGYYIGCAADEIQVHRATITGSIGVFALVPDASGTLDLLGIHRHSVSTGPRAETMSLTAPFSDERRAALQQIVSDVDVRFQSLVAERRHIPIEKMPGLAGGRVYLGEQAVGNGLADGFGTLTTAVAAARKRAGITELLPLERYPHERGLLARFGMGGAQTLLPYLIGAEAAHLQRLARLRGVQILAWSPAPRL